MKLHTVSFAISSITARGRPNSSKVIHFLSPVSFSQIPLKSITGKNADSLKVKIAT